MGAPVLLSSLLPRAAVRSEVPFAKFGMPLGDALAFAEAITLACHEYDRDVIIHLVEDFDGRVAIYSHPDWQGCTWCIHLADDGDWDDGESGSTGKTAMAALAEATTADEHPSWRRPS